MTPHPRFSPWLLALACAAGAGAHAADSPAPMSRIVSVTVYPGSATVERTLAVPENARTAVFDCLTQDLQPNSLQVRAAGATQIGEITVTQQSADDAGAACASGLDGRIEALQDQIAGLKAQSDGLDYVTSYLKGLGENEARKQPIAPADIAAAAQAVRESAQKALAQQVVLRREQRVLEKELKPLVEERDRTAGKQRKFTRVAVTLSAPKVDTLQLTYEVRGPSWQPAYRAALDTETHKLRLQRLGRVQQATGEDWTNTAIKLSTGQPNARTVAPLPRPWRLNLAQPEPLAAASQERAKMLAAPMPAAPAPAMAERASAPRFDVAEFQGVYATEFVVPQRVSVASGDAAVALDLGSVDLPATERVRATPATDDHAYLTASFKLPEGVWPRGAVTLYRDGAFVGEGRFDASAIARDGLAFGRDERVTVATLAPEQKSGTTGGLLSSGRNQRVDERRYSVKNGHDQPIALQVLDAAPVSQNDEIKVESTYEPKPETTHWHDTQGLIEWQQELAAGATQQFRATHTISWPKKEELVGNP